MIHEQGSVEWHEARAKRITASEVWKILEKSKKDGKPLKARADYLTKKVVEILTGVVNDDLNTPAIRWGRDNEEAARTAFQMKTGLIADKAPFIVHPEIPYVGASPDALVELDAGAEIKCPYNSTVHFEMLMNGMPTDHAPQVQMQMWVTGRPHWYFVSFDPRFPAPLHIYVERIAADPAYHKMLEAECAQFWAEVQVALKELEAKAA